VTDQDGQPASDGISWVPVLGMLEPMPLTTFETGGGHDGVPVPEAGGAVIDKEIAELVALLNRAGIKTFQSCQDIGANFRDFGGGPLRAVEVEGEEDGEFWTDYQPAGEELRYGCIVVEWDQFPKVGRVLPPWKNMPGGRWLDRINHNTGWLFSASPNARFVSILFPWRDLDAFTASVKAAIAEATS